MKKIILSIAFISAFALSASAQDCPVGQVCFSQEAADKISAGLAELKASRALIVALEQRDEAKDQLLKAKDDLLAQKDLTIEAQQETIVRLTNLTCSKSQFLIFIYRTKRCS